jgi:hypothetical protein
MFRSGQLGLRCTVKPNCSSMFACLTGASVTCDCALDTSDPTCVPEAAMSFFIPVVHSLLGAVGTWQHRNSPLEEARSGPRDSARAHLDKEVMSEFEEHVAAPELSSQGGRARSHGTRGSVGAHLDREAMPEAKEQVAAPELNSARR